MKYLSLFSGIEAASVAWATLGWEPAAFAEIEPFPCAVLAHHYPDVPNVGDVQTHDWAQYAGAVDLIIGGPPCQAFSVAGLRKSLDDHRGNLSLEYMRIIHAVGPYWSVTENVPGWLSTKDNAFGCFLGGLVGEDAAIEPTGKRWTDAGVVSGPERTAAWRILDAQYFGVAQRRRRVFVLSVRGSGNWACAAALFPVCDDLQGNNPPRRETREESARDVARSLGARGNTANRSQASSSQSMNPSEISPTLDVGKSDGLAVAVFDPNQVTSKTNRSHPIPELCHTLPSTPNSPVAFSCKDSGQAAVAVRHDKEPKTGIGIAPTLQAADGGSGVMSVASEMSRERDFFGQISGLQVRRLLPIETEKLQGFPPDYTLVPFRNKPASDGPRYRAIGNSMAVPVINWLGRRIQMVELAKPRTEQASLLDAVAT